MMTNTKTVLFSILSARLPNLDACSGFGDIRISSDLYFEYQHKLTELLRLSEKIHEMAQKQLGDRYPSGY